MSMSHCSTKIFDELCTKYWLLSCFRRTRECNYTTAVTSALSSQKLGLYETLCSAIQIFCSLSVQDVLFLGQQVVHFRSSVALAFECCHNDANLTSSTQDTVGNSWSHEKKKKCSEKTRKEVRKCMQKWSFR